MLKDHFHLVNCFKLQIVNPSNRQKQNIIFRPIKPAPMILNLIFINDY